MPPTLMPTLTCWPAVPSKTIRAILPTLGMAALIVAPPMEARPVKITSAAVLGDGGTKKSSVLCVDPPGVARDRRPEVAPPGTATEMFVGVDEVIGAGTMLKRRRLFVVVGSKFVPVIETAVPGVAIVGVKLVMVGAPLVAVTVKAVLLDADPAGAVTPIEPVVAPVGTVTTSWVGLAEDTVAAVPLKVTVFSLAVALNPVP